ncbi:hypothetical protein EYF80_061688 [Liparis tanakae]|uniref:Uncharacterized protein n=1 Tax=Liparis tanakae TaxID=230148 RepID=A0A4Z2EH93_9TELE|nr:hypothetical protein EYF80_061688 [Liparis tanakae]
MPRGPVGYALIGPRRSSVKRRASYPVHVLGSRVGRKHGQDARPASHVQHHFVLEDVLVVVHGVPVEQRAGGDSGTRTHLGLMNMEQSSWQISSLHISVLSLGILPRPGQLGRPAARGVCGGRAEREACWTEGTGLGSEVGCADRD